jgi:hypothetical protein
MKSETACNVPLQLGTIELMNFPASPRGGLLVGLVIILTGQLTARAVAAVGSLRVATSSENNLGWVVLIAVMAAGIGGLVFYFDRERANKIEAFANSLGVPFRRTPRKSDEELPIGCSLEQKGCNHVIENVLEAIRTDELVLTMFDFKYTTDRNPLDYLDTHDSSQTYNQTISRIQSPLLKLPYFNLFPETIFKKVGKMFGGSDINFPEAPEFSDRYILRGGNEAALRTIFTPALRGFLEPLGHLTIEGADDVLFVYRWPRRTKGENYAALIEENRRLLALFLEGQRSIAAARG